jgi:hypothetical protein
MGKTTPKMTALTAKSETERFTIELAHIVRVWLRTGLLNQRTLGAIIESRWLSGSQKWGGSSRPCRPVSYGPISAPNKL